MALDISHTKLTVLSSFDVGFFLTKIFHPNVSSNGAICVNTLKRDWKPDHGISHILLVRSLILGYLVVEGPCANKLHIIPLLRQ